MNLLPLSLESLPALCRARLMIKIAIVVACCGLCSSAPAVNPPPDGGYPNGNTAVGDSALFSLTTGHFNTATGFQALLNNTTGYANTANGYLALYSNTTGYFNTANGLQALYSNTTGINNTANGLNALYYNRIGNHNVANGVNALLNNTTGIRNTATGGYALRLKKPATVTQQRDMVRSEATPAHSTPHWALMLGLASRPAATTSILPL